MTSIPLKCPENRLARSGAFLGSGGSSSAQPFGNYALPVIPRAIGLERCKSSRLLPLVMSEPVRRHSTSVLASSMRPRLKLARHLAWASGVHRAPLDRSAWLLRDSDDLVVRRHGASLERSKRRLRTPNRVKRSENRPQFPDARPALLSPPRGDYPPIPWISEQPNVRIRKRVPTLGASRQEKIRGAARLRNAYGVRPQW